jgi:hypothetical protein
MLWSRSLNAVSSSSHISGMTPERRAESAVVVGDAA